MSAKILTPCFAVRITMLDELCKSCSSVPLSLFLSLALELHVK